MKYAADRRRGKPNGHAAGRRPPVGDIVIDNMTSITIRKTLVSLVVLAIVSLGWSSASHQAQAETVLGNGRTSGIQQRQRHERRHRLKAVAATSDGHWSMPESDLGVNLIKQADAQTKAINDRKAKEAKDKADADAAAAKAKAEADAATAASRSAARGDLPSAVPASGGSASDAVAYAQSAMSTTEYECIAHIITNESGWNVNATNASSGAYGLGQALPGSKMASAGADWQSNGVTQMKWTIGYVNSRYGGACNAWSFWQANHYY
jgi:hypothetical protein